jgi:hypothetical protein
MNKNYKFMVGDEGQFSLVDYNGNKVIILGENIESAYDEFYKLCKDDNNNPSGNYDLFLFNEWSNNGKNEFIHESGIPFELKVKSYKSDDFS